MPSANDKNFINFKHGGTNYAIAIQKNGSVLANCVGYAWGRASELLGGFHQLSRANAEDWFGKNDGYKRGQTPKLGAIMCWAQGRLGDGRDGAGHVAVVEEIHADGSVTYSNSDYGGSKFYTRTIKPPYNLGAAFRFQGFIYLPVDFVTDTTPAYKPATEAVARDVMAGKYGNGQDRINRLKAEGYNPTEVQNLVNKLLNEPAPKPKPNPNNVVDAVIRGDYGNGQNRRDRLAAEGYNPDEVQNLVNAKLNASSKKSIDTIAREVINGDWGNGNARKAKLEAAGYNYREVQARVNQLL